MRKLLALFHRKKSVGLIFVKMYTEKVQASNIEELHRVIKRSEKVNGIKAILFKTEIVYADVSD